MTAIDFTHWEPSGFTTWTLREHARPVVVVTMVTTIPLAPAFIWCRHFWNAYQNSRLVKRCLIEAASADVSPRGLNATAVISSGASLRVSPPGSFFERETFHHLIIAKLLTRHRPAVVRCRRAVQEVLQSHYCQACFEDGGDGEKKTSPDIYIYFPFPPADAELYTSWSSPLRPQLWAGCSWTEARPVSLFWPQDGVVHKYSEPPLCLWLRLFWYWLRVLHPCYLWKTYSVHIDWCISHPVLFSSHRGNKNGWYPFVFESDSFVHLACER